MAIIRRSFFNTPKPKEPELKVIGIITFGRYVHDLGFYVDWKGAPAESRKYYPGWRQDLFYWLEETPLEVIGNIHENPELLEEEKCLKKSQKQSAKQKQ